MCTEVQTMFQDLSSKVTDKATNGAIKILKRTYSYCGTSSAWDASNSIEFDNCTKEIGSSEPLIIPILNDIEKVANNNEFAEYDLWLLLEDNESGQETGVDTKKLEIVTNAIKKMSVNSTSTSLCQKNCLMKKRKMIVQMKMIKWGYYGPAEAPAGLYIAYHHKDIGPFFTSSLNSQWPYHPLNEAPNDLEIVLNKYLVKLTEELSKGKLKGISILDLPAFGSPITSLDNLQNDENTWTNEVNHAMYHNYNETMSKTFNDLKEQSYYWSQYMDNTNRNDSNTQLKFPPTNIENPLNFSRHINEDFETFLKVTLTTVVELSHSNVYFRV